MKKRGQVEFIGALFLIGVVIVSGISTIKVLSENRYIGNTDTKEYYDLSKCLVKQSEKNLVYFKTKEEAEKNGFRAAGCN